MDHKKFVATFGAFVMTGINHFVLHQSNPDLDHLVVIVTACYHAFETITGGIVQASAIVHHMIDVYAKQQETK